MRKFFKSVALISAGLGLSLSLSNCGVENENSLIKVTNGLEIPNSEFPSVVLLYDAKLGAICTGTFVTETVVLTAAHCTASGKVDSLGNVDTEILIVNIEGQGDEQQASLVARSTKVVRNPLWDKNGSNVNSYDLGLIYFPEGIAKEVTRISKFPARSNDSFTIVGFGLNQTKDLSDSSTATIKRIGYNKVGNISSGFINFNGQTATTKGDGTNAASSSGDSGGPLLISGSVAGITSGGGNSFGTARSLYVDLHSASSQAFLSDYLKL